MTPARRRKIVVRFSLLSMAIVAAFWYFWSLFAPVPVVNKVLLDLFSDKTLELPFTISRWWDIVFAGLWTTLVTGFITRPRVATEKNWFNCLLGKLPKFMSEGLSHGALFGVFISIVYGIKFGLLWIPISSIFYALIGGLLGALFFVLFDHLFHAVQYLHSSPFWQTKVDISFFWNWFIAKKNDEHDIAKNFKATAVIKEP